MVEALPLLQPAECALLPVVRQAGLALAGGSTDRRIFLSSTVALAPPATAFERPIVASTSAAKAYRGPLMPAIQAVFLGVTMIERCRLNHLGAASAT